MFAEIFFKKDVYSINLNDLKSFFAEEQVESGILELKSGQVGLEGIYKEICAFLNSEGGLLIVGAPKEQSRKLPNGSKETYCVGELIATNYTNRDWLIQKISSNISPIPLGIKVQDVFSDSGTHFVIEIPQSQIPPHQSNDGTYYIRLERDSKPAPHGLVEALFFKRQTPVLKCITTLGASEDENVLNVCSVISNTSPYPTEKTSISIYAKNVSTLTQHNRMDNLVINNDEDSMTLNYNASSVLWEGLSISINFEIKHKNKPFFINILTWSRDAKLIKSVGVYDPTKMEFIECESPNDDNLKGNQYYLDLLSSLID